MNQTIDTSTSPQCAETPLFSQIEKRVPLELLGSFQWQGAILLSGRLPFVKNLDNEEVGCFLEQVFETQNYSRLLAIYREMSSRFDQNSLRMALQSVVERRFPQWARDFFRMAHMSLNWPVEFLSVCVAKGLSHQELSVLLTPLEPSNQPNLLRWLGLISEITFSRQQLSRALEWGTERLLMLDSIEAQQEWLNELNRLTSTTETADHVLNFIKAARFPNTTRSEVKIENMITALEWPKTFTVQTKRWGDVAGAEIKFQVTSAADLLEKSQKLVRLAEKWQQNSSESKAVLDATNANEKVVLSIAPLTSQPNAGDSSL